MRFSVLASGSRANCTFIEGGGVRLLIDCGLSAKQAGLRLAQLGIDPGSLDGILVTHEHSDHINGISVLSRRCQIPVYANRAAASCLEGIYGLEIFDTGCSFDIGNLQVSPFSVVHDALEPVGFALRAEGVKLAQATDLGKITTLVRESMRESNVLIIEANHDLQLLQECEYPWELKQRIASSYGHLSNDDCAEFIAGMAHPDLWHVMLGHLSENSNTPEAALAAMDRHLTLSSFSTFACASAGGSTPLIEVEAACQQMAV